MSNSKKSLVNFSAFADQEESEKEIQGWVCKGKGKGKGNAGKSESRCGVAWHIHSVLSDITDCVADVNDIGGMGGMGGMGALPRSSMFNFILFRSPTHPLTEHTFASCILKLIPLPLQVMVTQMLLLFIDIRPPYREECKS